MGIFLADDEEFEVRLDAAVKRLNDLGWIATTGTRVLQNADLIIGLAANYRLPTIYPRRRYVDRGGLCSYGRDVLELSRLARGYVDRILRGEKPTDLPVQAPNKYELIVNLKTAKALGLTIPPSILARADQVIE